MGVCGISHRFQWLSPTPGQIPTRYSPVRRCPPPEGGFSLDLHVLGLPPAFVLSQDQTLKLKSILNAFLTDVLAHINAQSASNYHCLLVLYKSLTNSEADTTLSTLRSSG